ncbi:MAG TPA: aldo/keto reductase [Gemmatimonadaceae bacterium]|nr:aldo/keto reductase [Gemmatimonadaceae bacterium]
MGASARDPHKGLTRRAVLASVARAAGGALLAPLLARAQQDGPPITRPIPSTGEALPVIGLGSWITFNVGRDARGRARCADVMRAFFQSGGRMIDSSPMYGSSQEVIGHAMAQLPSAREVLFSADKVWTGRGGAAQIEESRRRWGVTRFDLLQVHNLVNWEEHLPLLLSMKAAQRLRYVGITTSEGRRHVEIEQLLRTQSLDFVQITYNVVDREVESRILPLAADRGIGVIVNRPFRGGSLVDDLERHPLPPWAGEVGCANWPQFLLKFIVSHPAVTCAIPATSRVEHLRENMGAALGLLPDERMRRRMVQYVAQL